MQKEAREKLREKLDRDQRGFRAAVQGTAQRRTWLREIRMALGISAPEVAKKLGISRSEIFRGEEREEARSISLATLERQAEAMECRLVYAVIPKKGTLADLYLKRAWDGLFGENGEKKFREMLRREVKERNRKERPPKQERKRRPSQNHRRIEHQYPPPGWKPDALVPDLRRLEVTD